MTMNKQRRLWQMTNQKKILKWLKIQNNDIYIIYGVYIQYYYMSNICMLPKWGLVLYRVCPIYIFMEVPSLGDVFYPRF